MKKIIDYYIVYGIDSVDLSKNVRDYITRGFQPYEQPFIRVYSSSSSPDFYQAMVKYEVIEEKELNI